MMAFLGNLKQNFCQAQFEEKVDSQPKIIVHQQLLFPYGANPILQILIISFYIILETSFAFFRPFF